MKIFDLLKKSAFAKISALLLLALLCALACLFYYLTYNAAAADNDSKLVTAELTSQSVLEKVDRNFYERFGDVQAYAFNKLAIQLLENDSSSKSDIQTFINTMTAYYVLYDLMMICNSRGQVIAVNTKDKSGKAINYQHLLSLNFAADDWFKLCISDKGPDGGAWYSDFMIHKDVAQMYGSDGYGMAFAAPIRNASGQVLGVWYNFASWNEVTDGIRIEAENNLRKNHPGALVFLTRANGEIISARDKSLIQRAIAIDSASLLKTNTILFDGKAASTFISGWGTSHGAYIYKGKHWHAVTLIPKSTITWSIFFSGKNFPAIVASLLVLAAISIVTYRYFKKVIIKRINFIGETQEKLGHGEIIDIPEELKNEDEIGEIIKTLSVLADNIKEKAAFADEIAKGNLKAELKDVSEKDILGHSLQNMRNQILAGIETDKKRNWATEGLAQIGVILRSHTSAQELYYAIVSFLVNYLNANQGGLFLFDDDTEQLNLKACHAYDKKKFMEKTVATGEGLIGQCFHEKQTIYITDIPQNYIHITSGLGEANPASILIVPLKTNELIFGVVEIASFNKFESFEIEFLEKIAESIATSVGAVLTNERTNTMVEQLQQQTEEMKAQEEEMRQNMEELSATQEEMMRKEREYVMRIESLEGKKG